MPRTAKKTSPKKDSTANLGFEAKLWLAADKLRNNMDTAVPKRVNESRLLDLDYKLIDINAFLTL